MRVCVHVRVRMRVCVHVRVSLGCELSDGRNHDGCISMSQHLSQRQKYRRKINEPMAATKAVLTHTRACQRCLLVADAAPGLSHARDCPIREPTSLRQDHRQADQNPPLDLSTEGISKDCPVLCASLS